jgi:hypothetical protein
MLQVALLKKKAWQVVSRHARCLPKKCKYVLTPDPRNGNRMGMITTQDYTEPMSLLQLSWSGRRMNASEHSDALLLL